LILITRGVLLPLHHGGHVGDVGEVGEAIGATPAAFPPPTFAGIAFVSWFRVSRLPPREKALGVFIYNILGQAKQFGAKTDGIGGPRPNRPRWRGQGWGPCHLVSFGPWWPPHVLLLLLILLLM
jgi:hypothetical protein